MYYANALCVLRRRRSRPAPTGDAYPQASSLPASRHPNRNIIYNQITVTYSKLWPLNKS